MNSLYEECALISKLCVLASTAHVMLKIVQEGFRGSLVATDCLSKQCRNSFHLIGGHLVSGKESFERGAYLHHMGPGGHQ